MAGAYLPSGAVRIRAAVHPADVPGYPGIVSITAVPGNTRGAFFGAVCE